MRIAVLGATSQIAKDFVMSCANLSDYDLELFARRPEAVSIWLKEVGLQNKYRVSDFSSFSKKKQFDGILNFVGVGDPAKAAAMGASIFDVTLKFDDMVLSYLSDNVKCKYLFLSSGAVYGNVFNHPVSESSRACFLVNDIQHYDWYGVAKLHAECRHRALSDFSIIDIRLFNYYSSTQDVSSRFFITDIVRSIQSNQVLITSPDNIVRDYMGPFDFYNLTSALLESSPSNDVVDGYTKAPVDKNTLFSEIKNQFGFEFEVSGKEIDLNATGFKKNYFSENRRASKFGFYPEKNSLESVLEQMSITLSKAC